MQTNEMTQRQRMRAGLLYDTSDPELVELRRKAHDFNLRYATLTEAQTEQRAAELDKLLGGHGREYTMEPPVRVDYGCHIRVGENFFSNFNLTILDCADVTIGDNVLIGPNVSIVTPVHPLLACDRNLRTHADGRLFDYEYAKPITIGNNVWIASNVVINGGVTIGDGAVIGSGSVVTRDIPSGVIAAGVPCRVLRALTPADKMQLPDEIL